MKRKIVLFVIAGLILSVTLPVPAFADGDVAGAVEETWIVARDQIRSVTDKVIFPVIDVILAILFFVKIATAYLDYRKHGQFDYVPPAILFACLVFSLTCPLYLWKILGM
mgnify:CR=1 FL=1